MLGIFIVLLVLYILIYPFKVKGAIHFNVFEEIGFISIKVFCFRIFSAKISLDENGKFHLQTPGKPKKKKKKPKTLMASYFVTIGKRLEIKKFEWYFTCGSNENAQFVSMLCGYILSLDAILSAILLERYKHVKIFNDIDPIYNEDRLEVSSSVVVSFRLLDMIVGVVIAYKNYLKVLKERKNVE